MAVHRGNLIGYIPDVFANTVGKYQSTINVTMEFNNGSKVLMYCNDIINVYNARYEYVDPICTFKDI